MPDDLERAYATDTPWQPWLREGGLTDGDKQLIALANDMAQAILSWGEEQATGDDCCASDRLGFAANALREIGAELEL